MNDPAHQARDVVDVFHTSQPDDQNEKLVECGHEAFGQSSDGDKVVNEDMAKGEADFLNDVCAAAESRKMVSYAITAGMTLQLQKVTKWFQSRSAKAADVVSNPSTDTKHGNPHNEIDRGLDEDVIPEDFIDHGTAPSRGDNETYHGGAKDSLWNSNRMIPDGLSGRKSGDEDDRKDDKKKDGNTGGSGGGDDGDRGWISGVRSSGVKLDVSAAAMPEITHTVPSPPKSSILKTVWNSGVILEKARSEAVYAVESVIFVLFPQLEGPRQAVSDFDQERRHRVIEYRRRMEGRLAHRDYVGMRAIKARFVERERQRLRTLKALESRGEYKRPASKNLDDSLLPEGLRPIKLRRTWNSVTMWKYQRKRRWVLHVPTHISWDDL